MNEENDPWAIFADESNPEAVQGASDDPWSMFPDAEGQGKSDPPQEPQPTGDFYEDMRNSSRFNESVQQSRENPAYMPSTSREDQSVPSDILDVLGRGALSGIQNSVIWAQGNLPGPNVANKAVELATGKSITERLSETKKDYKPEDLNWAEDALFTMGEWLPGMLAGGKGAEKLLPKATTKAQKLLRYLGIGAASDAGGSQISADPDSDTFLIDALGKGRDKEASFDEELFRKKTNLMIDAWATSGLIGGGFLTGKKLGQWGYALTLKPLKEMLMAGDQTKIIAKSLLDVLGDVDASDSAEVVQQKYQKVLQIIKDNKEVFLKFSKIDPNMKDVEFDVDTITAVIRSLDPEQNREFIAELERLKEAALSGKAVQLDAALDRPAEALGKHLDDAVDSRGGMENIQHARDTAIEGAQRTEIDPLKTQLDTATAQLDEASKRADELIKNDPTFEPLLKQLGNEVNIDFTSKLKGAGDTIVGKINRASKIMTEKKNELYKAIPNADVDQRSLEELVDQYGDTLPQQIKSKLGKMEVIDEQGTMGFVINEDLGYKELVDLIPKIEKVLETIDPKKNFDQITSLKALKNEIEEYQLDFVAQNGDEATVKAVEKAKKYFQETYAPFWRDGRLEELQQLGRMGDVKPLTAQAEGRAVVEETFRDPTKPEYTEQIADLLKRSEGGKSTKPMLDWGLLEVLKDLQPKINADGKIDVDAVQNSIKTLSGLVPLFEKVSPGKVKELNTFLTKLRDNKLNAQELEKQIQTLTKQLEGKEGEIWDATFKEFYTKADGKTRELLPDSYESFKKLFSDTQNMDRVNKILDYTGNDPRALKGAQAAYSTMLKDEMFGTTKTAAHVKRINLKNVSQLTDPKSAYYQMGKRLYGDDYMKLLTEAGQMAQDIASTTNVKRGGGSVVDGKGFVDQGRAAANRIITWMFGVLNPSAARIRTVTGQLIKNNDPEDQIRVIFDTLLSNPDDFIRVATQVAEKQAKELDGPTKRIIFKAFVKGGVYQERDEDEFFKVESMESLFGDALKPKPPKDKGPKNAAGAGSKDYKFDERQIEDLLKQQ